MQLDRVPDRRRIYLDATVCIYHFAGASAQCTGLLERCERGTVAGVTGAHVLAEVAHRLMAIEAVRRGLVTPGNVATKLRAKPEVVQQLSLYQTNLDLLGAIGLEILPLDSETLAASAAPRREHGLLVNDSLTVTLMRHAQLQAIATSDRDFLRVPGLDVYLPTDLSPALPANT
jgi:predicted nucleic acid-binding protein